MLRNSLLNTGHGNPTSFRKTKKKEPKVSTIDYEETSGNHKENHKDNHKDKNDDTKPPKPTKAKESKSTPKSKVLNEKAHPAKGASNVDVNAIPNPAPAPDVSASIINPQHTIYTGILPVILPTTAFSTPYVTPTAGFSPLPVGSSMATTTSLSSSSSTMPTASTKAAAQQHSATQTPKHLSTVMIALVAVGAALVLLGGFIVLRVCTRPRKRTHLVPSLPILQDAYPDEDVRGDEESLFGGKERTSNRPGSNALLWNWTQYPHASISKPPPVLEKRSRSVSPPITPNPSDRRSPNFNEKSNYPLTDREYAPANPPAAPLQQMQRAITRAANRISTMSTSFYGGSPQSNINHGIGIAVGGSPLTADGLPLLQRNGSKTSPKRLSKNRLSVRQSMFIKSMSANTSGLYAGSMATSPPLPAPAPPKIAITKSNSIQGRARVRAPYTPGFLHTSVSATGFGYGSPDSSQNPFDDAEYVDFSAALAQKSAARRERDTKALTSALGLASPPPPPSSPQPTLYPDDSITLAGDRRRPTQSRVQSVLMSPTMEASARLGNLMLENFASMASLTSTAAPSTKSKIPLRKRADDKPPRVPSPPPMPSLAQMALAHTNPEDFADYRSPTYSIYGLYEAERKSRLPGQGGY